MRLSSETAFRGNKQNSVSTISSEKTVGGNNSNKLNQIIGIGKIDNKSTQSIYQFN